MEQAYIIISWSRRRRRRHRHHMVNHKLKSFGKGKLQRKGGENKGNKIHLEPLSASVSLDCVFPFSSSTRIPLTTLAGVSEFAFKIRSFR